MNSRRQRIDLCEIKALFCSASCDMQTGGPLREKCDGVKGKAHNLVRRFDVILRKVGLVGVEATLFFGRSDELML